MSQSDEAPDAVLETYAPHIATLLKGGIFPVMNCTVCRKPVRDYRLAHVVIPPSSPDLDSCEFAAVHKGSCDRILRTRYPEYGWLPLDVWFYHLIYNIGMSTRDLNNARTRALMFEVVREV